MIGNTYAAEHGAAYVPHPVTEDAMPLYARSEVLDLLKDKGYSSYRLREEKILSPHTIQKIRNEERLTMHELEIICDLLHVQPGRIIGWRQW